MKVSPLKIKITIFIIFAAIGIGILVNTALSNRKQEADINKKYKTQISTKENDKKQEEIKQQQSEQKQEEDQKNIEDQCKKALQLLNETNYYGAVDEADVILKVSPENYEAYAIKGIALCYIRKQIDGLKEIDSALKIKPDSAFVLYYKGLAYELYWQYDDAIKYYTEGTQVQNKDSNVNWCYYGLASCYNKKNDTDKAKEYINKATDNDADMVKVVSADKALSKLYNQR